MFSFQISFLYLTTFYRKGEESVGEKDNKQNKEETAHDKGEQCEIEVWASLPGNGEVVENADDHIDNDTSEDTTHTIHKMRKKGNPWRDSGYITNDEEDSIIEQFDYKPEINDKKQERIPSIFLF